MLRRLHVWSVGYLFNDAVASHFILRLSDVLSRRWVKFLMHGYKIYICWFWLKVIISHMFTCLWSNNNRLSLSEGRVHVVIRGINIFSWRCLHGETYMSNSRLKSRNCKLWFLSNFVWPVYEYFVGASLLSPIRDKLFKQEHLVKAVVSLIQATTKSKPSADLRVKSAP